MLRAQALCGPPQHIAISCGACAMQAPAMRFGGKAKALRMHPWLALVVTERLSKMGCVEPLGNALPYIYTLSDHA